MRITNLFKPTEIAFCVFLVSFAFVAAVPIAAVYYSFASPTDFDQIMQAMKGGTLGPALAEV